MRVVVAEDSALFREGLVRVLDELGYDVVAAVSDAAALVREVGARQPDLAVVDIRMPPDLESDGARAAASIRSVDPDIGLVLLSQHIELRHCLDLIGSPGFGYLLKDRVLDLDDFDAALRRVAGGGTALDPEVVRALVQGRAAPSGLDALSTREREVLDLVAQGHTNTAAAAVLHLSDRTVEAHLRSIFTKLGLHDDGSIHRRVLAVVTYLNHLPRTGDR
jgi:DNA-binding NarL/FixJ family response regulator